MVSTSNTGNDAASVKTSLLSIERVVALLTPTVFGPSAMWISGVVARNFPGLAHVVTPSQVTAIEITAFAGAVLIAWKWLHGRQRSEALLAQAAHLDLGAIPAITQIDQVTAHDTTAEVAQGVVERVLGELGLAASQPSVSVTHPAAAAAPEAASVEQPALVSAEPLPTASEPLLAPAELAPARALDAPAGSEELTGPGNTPPPDAAPAGASPSPQAETDWPIPNDPAPAGTPAPAGAMR